MARKKTTKKAPPRRNRSRTKPAAPDANAKPATPSIGELIFQAIELGFEMGKAGARAGSDPDYVDVFQTKQARAKAMVAEADAKFELKTKE